MAIALSWDQMLNLIFGLIKLKNVKRILVYIPLLIIPLLNSCIEDFNAATIQFEDAIVIEATVTNELKQQVVKLSRTYKLEESESTQESGAVVQVNTESNTYNFSETEPGVYVSDIAFRAEPNMNYTLSVTASDGRAYISEPAMITTDTPIDTVYAERMINDDGVDGVGVFVDSFDPTNSSKYYGYEYEETYQIIVPLWSPYQFQLINNDPVQFELGLRTQEERVCYNTIRSKGRLLTDTNLLSEDRVSKFLIEFIPMDDLKISTRYSILLKQYIQSLQAYNFHKTLNNLSTSDNLFSQNQPGFIDGNISSVNFPNEKVIGYFEVSTVSEQRLFFNRSDFFQEPYQWPCGTYGAGDLEAEFGQGFDSLLKLGKISYVTGGMTPGDPLVVTLINCGDCTTSGSNIKPNFWID